MDGPSDLSQSQLTVCTHTQRLNPMWDHKSRSKGSADLVKTLKALWQNDKSGPARGKMVQNRAPQAARAIRRNFFGHSALRRAAALSKYSLTMRRSHALLPERDSRSPAPP